MEERSVRIAYYVSGHGLGHASRSAALAQELLSRETVKKCVSHGDADKDYNHDDDTTTWMTVSLCIVTAVDRTFFLQHYAKFKDKAVQVGGGAGGEEEELSVRYCDFDRGVYQSNAFQVDVNRSVEHILATYGDRRMERVCSGSDEELMSSASEMVDIELAWMRQYKIDIVVSDCSPIPIRAAFLCGIKSIYCVTNFTWDYIYEQFDLDLINNRENRVQLSQVIETMREFYSSATLLRLPGYCPMPAFHKRVDIPLIVRTTSPPSSDPARGQLSSSSSSLSSSESTNGSCEVKDRRLRNAMRQKYNIPENSKVVLVTFSVYNVKIPIGKDKGGRNVSLLPAGWFCIIINYTSQGNAANLNLPNDFIVVDKGYIPDLICCCDLVLSKLGYGIVSECLSLQRSLLYIRRDNFDEELWLIKEMEKQRQHMMSMEMKRQDFEDANWRSYIEMFENQEMKCKGPCGLKCNGASIAAQMIIENFIRLL